MMQADLLENISETKYLSVDNYTVYRTVMRIFYLEHQKMHYQMDRDAVLGLLRQQSLFAQYSPEQLAIDLQQLVKWKNLIPIQDPRKPRTIAEFKNRQFQYMMSQPAIEIERMTITLENLSSRTAALSASPFRRIREDLYRAEQLDGLSLREVQDWWEDLQEDFQRLSQSHQDYLREFYGPGMEMQMKAVEFITYKQNLVRYLEEFIQDLQHSVAQIGAQLEGFSPEETAHILELVRRSALEIPRPQSEQTPGWEEELLTRCEGVWRSLLDWFTGSNSTARQVLNVTNEVIRRTVQNAALLVQMENMGVSNKAELRHLLTLFAGFQSVDEAHRLSALVFGVQQVRHFAFTAVRETERVDLSTYDEAPVSHLLQPRTRSYRPRMDRSGFADKSHEKAAQRQKILEEERALRQKVMGYIHGGKLDLAALDSPLSPDVRAVFLSWVAAANLSPDHRGRTQYGQAYTLERRGDRTCRLVCTDGTLTMPDCVLIFEEAGHE
ncbi:TIGR02677 family protein [uncultured Pseudoflavonifractor sp.]|uniref:TIGR02677 family protein n=1 Tax=uncultured Pseudoflavonifractor sp. TaxID=1221379 RepID=UPI0025DCBE4E|nr:TIGR02677 family protein [uncultured Pseudoflavonifractor sp.]